MSGRRQANATVEAAEIQAQAARDAAAQQQAASLEALQLQGDYGIQAAQIAASGGVAAAHATAGATAFAAMLGRESAQESLAEQRRQFDATTENLAPYIEIGEQFLPEVQQAATVAGLEARINEIMDTSAFQELRAESMGQASSMLAQSGMRRSGRAAQTAADINIGTALNMEHQLYGRQMNNVNIGQAAAARQGNFGQNYANAVTGINMGMAQNVGNIAMQGAIAQGNFLSSGANNAAGIMANTGNMMANTLQQGAYYAGQGIMGAANAQAGGIMGAANARAQGTQNMINTGVAIAGLFFSDEKMKKNIEKIGEIDGLNLYEWDWHDFGRTVIGTEMSRGFKAQEVEKIHPDCVVDIGKFKAIDYPKLYDKLERKVNARIAA